MWTGSVYPNLAVSAGGKQGKIFIFIAYCYLDSKLCFIKIPKYRSQSARLAPVFAGKGNSRPAASMETIGRMRNKKERKEEKMERWRRKKLGAQVPLQYFLRKKGKGSPPIFCCICHCIIYSVCGKGVMISPSDKKTVKL